MKVSFVNNPSQHLLLSKKQTKTSQSLCAQNNSQYAPVPSTRQYLSFLGGYSVDLKETYENLDKNSYPKDIRQSVENELIQGNKNNKTLIDIHKEKYGIINKMKSLDEVKSAFSEFQDVLSDREVEYNKNSFIDDVKNDKLEWFDSDTDLALQLLQMYWADGFSLTDLKEYTGGKNIAPVLEKFNIPRLTKTYGAVLKLSDKEYNERFTKEMSLRKKGIQIKRAEKEDGVYIPRGPLSDEHKKHISEGLLKHYSQHPEKLSRMSKRMREYYQNNPEEKEKLSQILTRAWELPESKSIRKKMSKFMGKNNLTFGEFAQLNFSDNENKNLLKEFWNRNPWAKVQWSKCMTKAWEIYKKEQSKKEEPDYVIEIYPKSLKRDMLKWMKNNGFDINKITERNLQARVTIGDRKVPDEPSDDYAHEAISAFFTREETLNLRADLLQISMLKTLGDLINTACNNPKEQALCDMLVKDLTNKLFDRNNTLPKQLSTSEAFDIYTKLVSYAYYANGEKFVKIFENNLEPTYQILLNNDDNLLIQIAQKAALTNARIKKIQNLTI